MILELHLRPDVTVLALIVPDDARLHQVDGANNLWFRKPGNDWNKMPLPSGSYKLIVLLREVTEDVLGELLICQDSVLGPGMVYWSYTSESFTCPTAIISMKDAIYKAGGDPKQNWFLIKKIA